MGYDDMTVAELKDLLRDRGLPLSGKKADLVSRLNDAEATQEEVQVDAEATQEEIKEEESQENTIHESEDPEENYEDEGEFFEGDGDFEEWDDFHTARQKPVLDESMEAALRMRADQRKKQPKFRRQEWFRYRRLSKTGYRKPKGKDSKMRKNLKYRSPMARVGYGKVTTARGLHPSGFQEVMVHRSNQLDGLDPEKQAVRIGASVGNRKRSRIHERADELGLRILNRRQIERKGGI